MRTKTELGVLAAVRDALKTVRVLEAGIKRGSGAHMSARAVLPDYVEVLLAKVEAQERRWETLKAYINDTAWSIPAGEALEKILIRIHELDGGTT